MAADPGQFIDGKYRTLRLLGRGGMGEVYEVQDEHGRRMALKLFSASGERADFLRKRFLAEGRILARMSHPRLVKVHDIGIEAEAGRPYFTMDLVLGPDGEPLTLETLRTAHELDELRVAALYADLREGIAYLHENGIVHRDVKIENVLVDSDGRAVLSDCGISRIFDPDLRHALAVTTTMTGDQAPILGSYGYMAPELKSGQPATPASDAYALGALVFRLLTGVWYEDDSTAMELLAGFNPGWAKLLGKLLSVNPEARMPMPENVRLERPAKRWHRTLAVAAIGLSIAVGAVAVYCQSRPTQYSFDEFFPSETEAVTP